MITQQLRSRSETFDIDRHIMGVMMSIYPNAPKKFQLLSALEMKEKRYYAVQHENWGFTSINQPFSMYFPINDPRLFYVLKLSYLNCDISLTSNEVSFAENAVKYGNNYTILLYSIEKENSTTTKFLGALNYETLKKENLVKDVPEEDKRAECMKFITLKDLKKSNLI